MFSQDWGYIASRLWQFVNETPIAEPHDGCCERRASARLLDGVSFLRQVFSELQVIPMGRWM